MNEFDTGYSVKIGKPLVNAEKKATGSSVVFPCEAIADGTYLVSLEVSGSVEAYRESTSFSSGLCTVGEYTLAYSSYELTVSGTSNNDIVRIMIEPLEVKITDAFRAVIDNAAPKSGGGSDGGRFIVTFSYDDQNETWVSDKMFEECVAAWNDGKTLFARFASDNGDCLIALSYVVFEGESIAYISFYCADAESNSMYGFIIDEAGVYYYQT